MPKEDWENDIPDYSLDEILAEFSSRQNPEDESETPLESDDSHPEEEDLRPEEEPEENWQEKRRPGRRLQRPEKKSGRRLWQEQEADYQEESDRQPDESEEISGEDAASETQAEGISAQEVRTEEPVTEENRAEGTASEETVAEEIRIEESIQEENEPEEIRGEKTAEEEILEEDIAEEEGPVEESNGFRFSKFGSGLFSRIGGNKLRSENPEQEEHELFEEGEEEDSGDFEDLDVSEDWAVEEAEEEEPGDNDVAETSLFTGVTQRFSGFTGRLFNRSRSEEDTEEDEKAPEAGEDQELPADSHTSASFDMSAEEENERPEGEKEEHPEDMVSESLSEADTEIQEEQPGPFDDETESTEETGFSAFTAVSQRVSGITGRLFNRRPDRNDTEENEQIPEAGENEELSWDIETSIDSFADEEKENGQPAAEMEEAQQPADLTGEVLSGTRAETEENQPEASEKENIDFSVEEIHETSRGTREKRQENNEQEAEWKPITEAKREDVLSEEGGEETEGRKRYTSFLTRIPFLSKYVKDRFVGAYGEEIPDASPDELAERYDKGLYSLTVRRWLVLVLAAELLVLAIIQSATGEQAELQLWNIVFPILCAVIQLVALALSYDLVIDGLLHLGINTIITVAALMAFLDSATMCFLGARTDSLPYCLIATLALFARLWGLYMERSSSRSACKTAAAAKEPYCVTLDPDRWDGQPAYTKWPGDITKFGSQIQSEDMTHFIFRRLTAPLLIACLVFSLISALISGRADLIIWNLAATTNACAGLAAALAFALPYWLCGSRLSKACVALAGWKGISRHSPNSYIILGDFDLFPPGSVTLSNMRIFPGYSRDLIVSYTATLINHLGSGLDQIFWEYMRSQGDIYRTAEDVVFHEGGISALIGTDRVLVGDAEFMTEAGVSLPQGLNVRNGVFCAVNSRLAGLFVLDFNLHATVRPSLSSLLNNGIVPVLATRDFNITPTMLTKRFRLPGSHMVYPGLEDRLDLSDPYQTHDDTPVCILCREGIGPLTEAVVGGRRLFSAVRLNTILAVAEIIIGLLLAFYLTAQVAFASLSMFNLLIFHLAWLIPILLISGWVNRY